MLDGAFQMIGFLAEESSEDEAWVPAGISRVAMRRIGIGALHKRAQIWAHVTLVDDGPKMKSCNIVVFDSDGPLVIFEGFRYAKLAPEAPEASLFTAKWVQSSINSVTIKEKSDGCFDGHGLSPAIVQLNSCLELLPHNL